MFWLGDVLNGLKNNPDIQETLASKSIPSPFEKPQRTYPCNLCANIQAIIYEFQHFVKATG